MGKLRTAIIGIDRVLDAGSSKYLVKKSWVISYCTESLLFIISIILLGHDHLSAAPEGTDC